MQSCHPINMILFPKPLLHICVQPGAIRIHEIALSNPTLLSCASSELIGHLLHTKKQLEEKFIEKIPENQADIKLFRKDVHYDLVFPDSIIVAGYILSRKVEALDKFNTHQRDNLHQFRKIIKDLKYVYEIIPVTEQQRIFLNNKLIDKLQKSIGEWHDTYSSMQLLSQNLFPGAEHCIDVLRQKEQLQLAALESNYPDLNL